MKRGSFEKLRIYHTRLYRVCSWKYWKVQYCSDFSAVYSEVPKMSSMNPKDQKYNLHYDFEELFVIRVEQLEPSLLVCFVIIQLMLDNIRTKTYQMLLYHCNHVHHFINIKAMKYNLQNEDNRMCVINRHSADKKDKNAVHILRNSDVKEQF